MSVRLFILYNGGIIVHAQKNEGGFVTKAYHATSLTVCVTNEDFDGARRCA